MKIFNGMSVIDNQLFIQGISCKKLVEKYGTPLYVMDENMIRSNCREFYDNFRVNQGNKVAYAGKAFLTIAMCQIINQEGLCLDVVSGGELYTAFKSGFPVEKVYFHGNNKTNEEIQMGIKYGVGAFVVDNLYEMEKINYIAKKYSITQDILLRITPGIEAHTHDYIKTGQVDSKFGFTIVNNSTREAIEKAIELPNVHLRGLHCHIGSQIFDLQPFEDEVEIMLNIIKNIKEQLNFEIEELDLGGGFGIYYTEGDEPKTIQEYCSAIINKAELICEKLNIKKPVLAIEPGRSIVGNAGTTLYTIGAIKNIPDIRKYVSVDGGMSDNIRPALYNAQYECVIANNVVGQNEETVTISGKCCESGDILLSNVQVPRAESGDILAIFSTGAYGYSMCSNYNKIPKAPVILVKDKEDRIICKRQSYEELISNEV